MNKKPGFKIDNSKLARLVAKAQKGNSKATDEVVNMISGYLYYYSLTLLGDDDKARDAVQDILLTMLQKLNTLENPKAFLGWMKTMTAHYCHNKVTRAKTQYSLDEMIETEDLSEQVCPSKPLETEETCALVREAVNALPVLLRESVMMHYFNQMSVREIAQTLDINENTVKSRLHSARQSMKKYLEKYGGAALASCLIPPMKLISYSLIEEAESIRGILIPFKTPAGAVKVAAANAVTASAVPIKLAAIACAAVITAGSVGAATGVLPISGGNSNASPKPKHSNSYAGTDTTAYTEPATVLFGDASVTYPGYENVSSAPAPSGEAATQSASPNTPAAPAAVTPTAVNSATPQATSPRTTVPSATSPSATSPSASSPAATKPAATTPAATKPASGTPDTTKPASSTPVAALKRIYIDTTYAYDSEGLFCHVWDQMKATDIFSFGSKNEACTKVSDNLYMFDLTDHGLTDGTSYGLIFGTAKGSLSDDFLFTTADYGKTLQLYPDPSKAPTDGSLRYLVSWK